MVTMITAIIVIRLRAVNEYSVSIFDQLRQPRELTVSDCQSANRCGRMTIMATADVPMLDRLLDPVGQILTPEVAQSSQTQI